MSLTTVQSPPITAGQRPDLDSPAFADLLEQLSEEFAGTAAYYDKHSEFPHANLHRLHEHGLLALTVPRFLGGSEATLAQARRVIGAVARGEPSTALVLVMQYLQHTRLQGNQAWPRHLRVQLAREAVEQGALINALRVEPDLGTPARGGLPGTVARRVEGGWRLDGRKIYSTGIPGLTWLSVWARSDESEPRVGTWLVHRDTPGIRIEETWDHLGMRATGSHDVVFEDVFVASEFAVDIQPAGVPRPSELDSSGVLWLAVLLSSIYDGVARSARDWLVTWLAERTPANLGAPLSSLPRFHELIGRIDSLLLTNRVLLDAAAEGRIAASEATQIKYLVTGNAISAVELGIEAIGNPGLARGNPLERHYRDVLCSRIHTPQNDAILAAVGRAAFALPARGGQV
ncbi:acyl-CoA dehydrogenase family protein [Pseudomonas gingeri]|uniref:Acyl-CoA/acyl-ACP dehydrogenase n=1 Tax=Pseudomonas gingeri TaxID=117681 RepID=A0A7Y7YA79_9PSED|nr:acyl-CoA dehydrogenase family protein [Pseudomonas gingeri]NWA00678.1 acyl-CoA/acyl-ACP dehydrogenase [Pseudomonas gingeri]NWA16278.1 acyl-CoA/acyl-ACP dehydrogenase [Pseudomonas gingeri]NWA54468.1 acyl-CoA/acyl-ACP dehydrogenase [Pseudomonas gingeri]NWA97455.1 acyl-CoA/acyl-ACP dehydrogenase [Pseudomonas gingeri]NWB04261.1 acyl-CoA/acyl-ACP dehydrogenase [Pseudomonas gingeri]